jgi:hypothetical protein
MARDQLFRRPHIAHLILAVGAVSYFLLCWPLYGRRGFPEKDPFWLAMIWLWVPPVFLSAIYDKWSKKRTYDLLVYALITGFVVSWSIVTVIPNQRSAFDALLGLILYGPIMIVGVLVVNTVSQAALFMIRKFAPQPFCERCGYCLHGLTEARCPECGTSFSADLLDPDFCPAITPVRRRWTALLFIMTLVATAAFPFAYRQHAFRSVASQGERRAEQDWASSNVTWYVKEAEINAMTPGEQGRFYMRRFKPDPSTGWQVERMGRDWKVHKWQSSYRKTIERKLRESGRKPPALD